MVLLASVFLFLSLRSLRGILLPLLVVVSSVVWALGLMAWLDATFFAINTIMPVLLVAIGVASGIHIIHDFLLSLDIAWGIVPVIGLDDTVNFISSSINLRYYF